MWDLIILRIASSGVGKDEKELYIKSIYHITNIYFWKVQSAIQAYSYQITQERSELMWTATGNYVLMVE